jgi:predicted nicotinamide N-methyase
MPGISDYAAFIRGNTLPSPALVSGIELHLAELPPPFWAFAWADCAERKLPPV